MQVGDLVGPSGQYHFGLRAPNRLGEDSHCEGAFFAGIIIEILECGGHEQTDVHILDAATGRLGWCWMHLIKAL